MQLPWMVHNLPSLSPTGLTDSNVSGFPNVQLSSSLNKSPTALLAYHRREMMDGRENGVHVSAQALRSQFLASRRSIIQVPLIVERAKRVEHPLYQDASPPKFSEAMDSCPRENISNFNDLLKEETLYLITEEGKQGRLPVLILSMKDSSLQKRPCVVFLHSTHKCKEWLRPLLEAYASRGYIAVAVDSRYHGERAHNLTTYRDALIASWKKGDTMPFIFDTAWDLIKLADYLTQREDIDCSKIGITGESLGGMHAWFAAFADVRYSVVVPIIGVQGFRWAIDNDMWQGRVDSIKPVFEEARIDLGKSAIDREVVEKVWDRIAPGLTSDFDSPNTIPAIAPRPLLILNGPSLGKPEGSYNVSNLFFSAALDGILSITVCGGKDVVRDISVMRICILVMTNMKFRTFDLRNTASQGEADPRCPIPGLKVPESRARDAYQDALCPENFQLKAQPGIGHQMTPWMVKEASDWFDKFLKQ